MKQALVSPLKVYFGKRTRDQGNLALSSITGPPSAKVIGAQDPPLFEGQ